ncbi:MAG: hypothetical protein M3464_03020 [Chloroflexota bacterium]|nr:hypothetical protein [Chloroflexota bacterium]
MESERFDALIRHVGTAAGTRRLALRTLFGAAAIVGGSLGSDVAAAGCRANRDCSECIVVPLLHHDHRIDPQHS